MGEDRITVSWDDIQKREGEGIVSVPGGPPGGTSGSTKSKGRRGLHIAVYLLVGLIVLGGAGAGIWFGYFRNSDGLFSNKTTAAIEEVLRRDAACNQGAASVADVVNRMRAVDTSSCPNDFRSAYLAHVHAWEMMADVESEAIALKDESESAGAFIESVIRGFLGDPLGKAIEMNEAQGQLQQRFKEAEKQVKLTFHRVEEVAIAHGARLPNGGNR